MATRSENKWEPAWVGDDRLEWITVPGTSVTLRMQRGLPLQIMRAWAADYNAFVEPLRDADSACYTPTNSVSTSNHLNATGMDLNWGSHPFHAKGTFSAAQMATLRDMQRFYTQDGLLMMFWAGDWKSPIDEMHHQLGYGTFNDPRTAAFVAQKIRPDGFSRFRRGNEGVLQRPLAVDVLMRATGVGAAQAAKILPGVINGLRDSQCFNPNRIGMWLAQMGHESANFERTEEYASGAAYEGRRDLGNTQPGDGVRFKGRSWIQITGRSNYTQLSKWSFQQGIVPTATYFVDNPVSLQEIQYAGLGPAWYWVVARSDINALSDRRDLVAVTQRINGGQNGAVDRRNRYDRAMALGDQLLALTEKQQELDEWDALMADNTLYASQSPYRDDDVPFMTLRQMLRNLDTMDHTLIVESGARSGNLGDIEKVARLAAGRGPGANNPANVARARAVIGEIQAAINKQGTAK